MSDLLERIKKHKGVYDPTQGYAEDEAAIMAGEDSAPGMEPEEYDPEQVPAHLFGPSREEGLPGGLTKKEVASFAEQAPLAEHLDDGRKHIPDMRRPIQPEKRCGRS